MRTLFKKYLWLVFLLFSCFAYAEAQDIDAFKLKETQKFSTNNHPKAKGINITIEHPKTWKAKEGERPNIVQKFSQVFDDGSSVMCLILIKELPSEVKMFTDEELAKEMFTEEVMKSMFPGNSKLLEHQKTEYDGQSGAISSFVMVQERNGIQIYSYVLQHVFVYSKKMVSIQCTVGGLSSNNDKIENLYKSYVPLFIQIGNSIVLHDKWNKNTVSEESSAMGIAFGEYGWISLIISALLTWGVGLLPPILIRFIFVRKPLSKKVAIILVSIFWFLNLGFFIAIGSQSKSHTALFLVALASYYILRKGHKNIENKNS